VQTEKKELTGFIMAENKRSKKTYEVGKELTAKILDIDKERKLLDLSHGKHFMECVTKQTQKLSLTSCQHENLLPNILPIITKFPKAKAVKARVELVKENYAVVSLPEYQYFLTIIPIRLFNQDEKEALLNKLTIGHTLDVKLCGYNEVHKCILGVPIVTNLRKIWDQADTSNAEENLKRKLSDIEMDMKSLVIGQKITGKVSSIQGFVAFIHVNKKICGRLHKAQCGSEQKFTELKKGAVISGNIINIVKDESKEICKVDLALEGCELKLAKNSECNGVIRMVQWNSSFPLVIELSAYIKGSVYFKDLTDTPQLLSDENSKFRSKIKDGAIIKCYPLFDETQLKNTNERLKISLIKPNENQNANLIPKEGEIVICRCIKAKDGHGMAVQLDDKVMGIIDITEISDSFESDPFDMIQKKGIFSARVLEAQAGKIMLTARKSLLDDKLWNVLHKAPTLEFQQHFDYITEEGDLRSKLIKFGTEWLQPGMIGLGYISNLNDKGCFIKVSHKLTVRASLHELTDLDIVNPLALYKPNNLVMFRITSIVEPKKNAKPGQKYINVSMRESIIKYGLSIQLRDLKAGQQCQAIIKKIESEQVWVQIKGSTLNGVVKDYPKDLIEGELINCTITKVEIVEGEKKAKIKLKYESRVDMNVEHSKISELYDKIMSGYKNSTELIKKGTEPMQIGNKTMVVDSAEIPSKEPELTLKDEELNVLEEIKQGEEENSEVEQIIQETIQDDSESSEENENENLEENKSENNEENEDEKMEINEKDEDSEEKPEKMDLEEAKKDTAKSATLKEKIREEKKLRQIEKAALEENQPKSIEEFEKLVLTKPNSSFAWLQYTAFILDNAGIDSARRLIERAIKTIPSTAEQEKLALWIGFLNLEGTYGTTESLQKAAERAVGVNDRKKIYEALANIYICGKKYEFALDVYKLLVKKYFNDVNIWAQYTDFLFKLDQLKKENPTDFSKMQLDLLTPRDALSRALQALDKKQHVDMIVKYGQQEYKYGNIESGRTMFEGVVTSYPKRTDIWGVYFDMEIKYGKNANKDYIRGLFERCTKLDLKGKKMMFFYKKWLDFELANGTPATVESVKQRAEEFVKLMNLEK